MNAHCITLPKLAIDPKNNFFFKLQSNFVNPHQGGHRSNHLIRNTFFFGCCSRIVRIGLIVIRGCLSVTCCESSPIPELKMLTDRRIE